jgi:hypothetical protein
MFSKNHPQRQKIEVCPRLPQVPMEQLSGLRPVLQLYGVKL